MATICYLLDVNVLIALVDSAHVHHDAAHEWFQAEGQAAWATCPLTENGLVRVLGNPRYPQSPGPPATVLPLLKGLCGAAGHHFWGDDLSLRDGRWISGSRLLEIGQVTDTYLLGLAASKGGRLATFDRRLVTSAVEGGRRALKILG